MHTRHTLPAWLYMSSTAPRKHLHCSEAHTHMFTPSCFFILPTGRNLSLQIISAQHTTSLHIQTNPTVHQHLQRSVWILSGCCIQKLHSSAIRPLLAIAAAAAAAAADMCVPHAFVARTAV
mmetsp:Transcript_19122/g.53518  ORF Transcript_19122/g.53518 Transcript_19122/m.53518 type:complete len:121 (+) Transcript_19122:521-883(+)